MQTDNKDIKKLARRDSKSRRNALRTLRRRDTVGILMLGACKVGKSALISRWSKHHFFEQYEPTIEEFHVKNYRHLEQRVSVGIIDMTGSWDFPAMIDLYLTRVDSVMFVYDIGCSKSIKNLHFLYERLIKVRGENHELSLSVVGTKIDKYKDVGDDFQNTEIHDFLKRVGCIDKHVLTSAKLDINVNEAFENALNEMISNTVPSEDAIKRLDKLMNKNGNSRGFLKRICCI